MEKTVWADDDLGQRMMEKVETLRMVEEVELVHLALRRLAESKLAMHLVLDMSSLL